MTTFIWNHGRLDPVAATERALIVDSWLTESGHTRNLGGHLRRFHDSCAAVGLSQGDFWSFCVAVQSALPTVGRLFPKVACSANGELSFEIRPAPAESRQATLLTSLDRRQLPSLKGPDLPELLKLRESAVASGATDALLVDSEGFVIEAGTAAVMWWEDETLCSSASTRVMRSVTAELLRDLAVVQGFSVARRHRTIDELAGREIWCVNSLHPIQVVKGIYESAEEISQKAQSPTHLGLATEVKVLEPARSRATSRSDKFRQQLVAL